MLLQTRLCLAHDIQRLPVYIVLNVPIAMQVQNSPTRTNCGNTILFVTIVSYECKTGLRSQPQRKFGINSFTFSKLDKLRRPTNIADNYKNLMRLT
jgi:hypothetical protein